MGTWGSAGVWHGERQRYRVRALHVGGGITGLGKWLLENAPDAESALAWIDGPRDRYQDGPASWEKHATYEYRDGRWWHDLDNGIGSTNYAGDFPIPLRLQLALGDEANHAAWKALIVGLDDAMGGPLPVGAPPVVDVADALVTMHDENDRQKGLLWRARETLRRVATLNHLAVEAHEVAETVTKTLEGGDA